MSYYQKLFLFVILLLAFSSCGLKYQIPESIEQFDARRQDAIKKYVKTSLNNDSIGYMPIAFGNTIIVKPKSYLVLDSLYSLKYKNESLQKKDKELDNIIEIQKQICKSDTAKIYYVENFIFSYGQTDSISVIESDILIDKQLFIKQFTVNSSLIIPKNLIETYKVFLFEESFIFRESYPLETEKQFYLSYKNAINQLTGEAKDQFIVHTLKIMEIASLKKSLNTTELLMYIAIKEIANDNQKIEAINFSDIFVDDGQNYWFTATSTELNEKIPKQYYFKFDSYLRLITKQLI